MLVGQDQSIMSVQSNATRVQPASKTPPPRAEKSKALHLCFANVRGVRGNFIAIQSFLLLNSPDLLALCESRLDRNVMSTSLTVPGYVINRLDSPPCHGLCFCQGHPSPWP